MDEQTLVEKALNLEKYPLARLLSLAENETSLAQEKHKKIFSLLRQKSFPKAVTIGWTGTPGAGKSSLLSKVVESMLEQKKNLTIGILAIDPSSTISGGALLGDRTRFSQQNNQVFFRSQASKQILGGLGAKTWPVVRIMEFLFDFVFVETVGIGQNETDIKHLSDFVYLILQPFAGDQIQFMKAGIMEIPNAFIINKCDEKKQAKTSYHQLVSSLEIFSINNYTGKNESINQHTEKKLPPVYLTSALTGLGIVDLAKAIFKISLSPQKTNGSRNIWFLKRRIFEKYGQWGLSLLQELSFNQQAPYEELYDLAWKHIQSKIC